MDVDRPPEESQQPAHETLVTQPEGPTADEFYGFDHDAYMGDAGSICEEESPSSQLSSSAQDADMYDAESSQPSSQASQQQRSSRSTACAVLPILWTRENLEDALDQLLAVAKSIDGPNNQDNTQAWVPYHGEPDEDHREGIWNGLDLELTKHFENTGGIITMSDEWLCGPLNAMMLCIRPMSEDEFQSEWFRKNVLKWIKFFWDGIFNLTKVTSDLPLIYC